MTPEGSEIILCRRRGRFEIRIDGAQIMDSGAHRSEEQLAKLTCASIVGPRRSGAEVLIGGLGMGFTLRAALDCLAPTARVTVAEAIEAVIEWNVGPLARLARDGARDSRVTILLADVYDVLSSAEDRWDAIMLDVDNGPAALSMPSNARLYGHEGLRRAYAALRSDGTIGIWAPCEVPGFAAQAEWAGFEVSVEPVALDGTEAVERHFVYLAHKASGA